MNKYDHVLKKNVFILFGIARKKKYEISRYTENRKILKHNNILLWRTQESLQSQ